MASTTYPNPRQDSEITPVLGDYTALDETHIPQLAPHHGSEELTLTFKSESRPYRDTKCAVLFITSVLLTYALGFVVVKNADLDLESKWRMSSYNPTSGQCELIQQATPHIDTSTLVDLLQDRIKSSVGDIDTDPEPPWAVYLVAILATLLLVTPLGGFFTLWILHRYTRQAVVASLRLQCFFLLTLFLLYVSTFFGLTLSMDIDARFAVILFLFSPIYHLIREWSRVHVVVQIMKSALHVVTQNLSLFMLHPVLSWVVILIDAPIITFIAYASKLGKISPDFDAIDSSPDECSGTSGAPCCQIEQPDWAVAYVILAFVVALWVILVAVFFRCFVVSGAIAEWFAIKPQGPSTSGSTKRSLRNALGPSFGTICCSASLTTPALTVLNFVTSKEHCYPKLVHLVEPFSPWGVRQSPCVTAAITGESFLHSAKISYDLSCRRSQPTLTVENRMVKQAINGLAFAFSIPYFFMVLGAMYYLTIAGRVSQLAVITAELCAIILNTGLYRFHRVICEEINISSYCTSDHNEQHYVNMNGHPEQGGDHHEPLLGAIQQGDHGNIAP